MIPPRANFNPAAKGAWLNTELGNNYHLRNRNAVEGMLLGVKIVYDYEPDSVYPLLWLQSDGTSLAAGCLPACDLGSVPVWIQRTLPRDGLLGYFLHDYAYRFGGLFFRDPGCALWEFRTITRAESDKLLKVQSRRDPVAKLGRVRAFAVWAAVRVAAVFRYHNWEPGRPVPQWPVDDPPDVDDPLPMY